MKMSTERVLTTHVGSFPPPTDLFDAHIAEDAGADHDPVGLSLKVRSSVSEIVRKQSEVGVDIVSDGELSKSSYTDYVKHRQNGIGSGERGGGGRGSGGIRDIRDSPPHAEPQAGRGTGRDRHRAARRFARATFSILNRSLRWTPPRPGRWSTCPGSRGRSCTTAASSWARKRRSRPSCRRRTW